MDRTRVETAQRALRMLGVVASDEPPTDDQMQTALDILDSIWAEAMQQARATWDIATGIPPEAFVPLANWLAAELAGEYAVASPMSRGSAKLRLLAVIRTPGCDDCCDAAPCDPCADYGHCGNTIYLPGGGPFDEDVGPPVYSES